MKTGDDLKWIPIRIRVLKYFPKIYYISARFERSFELSNDCTHPRGRSIQQTPHGNQGKRRTYDIYVCILFVCELCKQLVEFSIGGNREKFTTAGITWNECLGLSEKFPRKKSENHCSVDKRRLWCLDYRVIIFFRISMNPLSPEYIETSIFTPIVENLETRCRWIPAAITS